MGHSIVSSDRHFVYISLCLFFVRLVCFTSQTGSLSPGLDETAKGLRETALVIQWVMFHFSEMRAHHSGCVVQGGFTRCRCAALPVSRRTEIPTAPNALCQ